MTSRSTQTKLKVAEIFKNNKAPLTLSEVFSKVKMVCPETAYSTVFRIVRAMVKENQLNSLDYKERGGRFEWAGRAHHHHLTCKSCGKVTDINDSLLNFKTVKIIEKTGFAIQKHEIDLIGICKPCQQNL